tara:strand:+ start:2629 stop:4104 length:1476 start_codon:yes stop_codon:yes gene_type:complete
MPEAPEIASNRKDLGDLQRGMLAILGGSVARTIARVMLIVFVVRLYGLSSFGYLGEVAALIELSAALASFGLPKTLLAYLDEVKGEAAAEGQLITNAIVVSATIGLVLAGMLWLIWSSIFPASSGVPSHVAIAVAMIAATELLLTVTRSRRVIRWDTLIKGVIKPWSFLLFAFIGYFLLVKSAYLTPVATLFAAYLGSIVVSMAIAMIGFIQTQRFQQFALVAPKFGAMFALAKRSFATAIVDAGSFSFRRLDIILLGLIAGPMATGIYYLVQQIATVVEKMRHLFEPMAAPVLAQSKSLAVTQAHLQKLCLWIFASQVGLATIFILFAVPVLGLFDVVHTQAMLLMALILFGEIAEGTSGLVELPMVFNHPIVASRNILVTFFCELTFVTSGAYLFGILGAAAGFAIAMSILAMLRFRAARRQLGLTIWQLSFVKPLVASITLIIVITVAGMFLTADNIGKLVAAIAASLALYLILLRFMGLSLRIADPT